MLVSKQSVVSKSDLSVRLTTLNAFLIQSRAAKGMDVNPAALCK